MKLLSRNIDKKGAGYVQLVAEEAEDMWHAYNLISIGDYLRSTTIRRVINESGGLTTTSRVHTTLTICVKSLDYDTQASVLRVKGTNSEVIFFLFFRFSLSLIDSFFMSYKGEPVCKDGRIPHN